MARISSRKHRVLACIAVAIVTAGGTLAWWQLRTPPLPSGFTSGNGRIEATDIDVATKYQGRIADILVREGDIVEHGQVLARMDTRTLEAELRQSQAKVRQAHDAAAIVAQRKSELAFAEKQFDRSRELLLKGYITQEKADSDETGARTARAALAAAESRLTEAQSSIEAAVAEVERLTAKLDDSVLKAPRRGRILYRVAEPGEVLSSGGKVLTLLDLTDV